MSQVGYYILSVRPEKNKQKQVRVHRLIAEVFLGDCPSDYVVNHKDGIKTNNNINNLEYVTKSDDLIHAYRTGLRSSPNLKGKVAYGEKHHFSTITEEEVIKILKINKTYGYGCRKIAKILGLSRGLIQHILSGHSWKHINKNNI